MAGDLRLSAADALIQVRDDVVTKPATDITPTQAKLNGSINPGGSATTYRFEYGKTSSYGMSGPTPDGTAGSAGGATAISHGISELEAETTYHYRLVATNAQGTEYGDDMTFRTAAPVHQFQSSFGTSGSGQVDGPRGLDVDAEGNVWVADTNHHRVVKFNSKGEYVSHFGSFGTANGQFKEPLDVAVTAGGDLWVTDGGNARAQKFNSKGEYLGKVSWPGGSSGQFVEPWGIDIGPDGTIWVADARYYRIEQFSAGGTFIREVHGAGWGGSGPAEFGGPTGLEIDATGTIWVVESDNKRVQKLSSTGQYLDQFGTGGTGQGQFEEPQAIAVKPSGQLLVTDRWNNDVQQFTPSGEYVAEFGSSQLVEPQGVAVGPAGSVYVSNTWKDRVELWQQAIPKPLTQSASAVTTGGATLNGTVNPRGVATTYRFEYGKTTAYGTNAPAPNASAGAGTSDVSVSQSVSGLASNALYHFRLVATNANGTIYGKDQTFTTILSLAAQLNAMSVVEPFDGSSESLARFASDWSALGWAGGANAKGANTTTGWRPVDAHPTANGAFYELTLSGAGTGIATVTTMAEDPRLGGRYFSLWLDAQGIATSRTGYELRVTCVSTDVYNLGLYKWQAGAQTELATKTNYSFLVGNSLALVDQGGTVSAWTDTGSGFAQLLSAADTTFNSGNAAVEGAGNYTRLTNFKAGSL